MDSIDKSWLNRLKVEQSNGQYIFSDCERWKSGGEEDLAFMYSSSAITVVSCSDEVRQQLEQLRLKSLHDYVALVGDDVLEVYIDDIDYYLPETANLAGSLEQIQEVTLDKYRDTLLQFLSTFSEVDVEKADFELDSEKFYLAFVGKEVAGAIASYCGVEPYESLSVLVKPKFRGQGIGKALVSFWANEVKSRNRVARYRTNAENTASIKLCESIGFKAHSRIQVLAQL
ncbi:GNAT family N-acetyltransferase [Vibrio campbellii]|uniref:GNAT family N-acetyltransferase n=1 Tax=Vibrio campbellii TaxID=680 RepID=UPI002499F18E|nr:GNAT family N-acetyltransferase [Vibrio campbellii]